MTKQINIGGVPVGGGAPIPIQSMCNTRTDDVAATVAQIHRLEAAGCDIIRVAVPDQAAARAVGAIKEQIHIPLVVDIHFDYRLALESVAAGCDKVRINPGNIGDAERVKAVARACREKGVPIRIGVNGGSLEKPLLERYGGVIHFCGRGDHYIHLLKTIPNIYGVNMSQPHLNDMATIYQNTVDCGIQLLAFDRAAALRDLSRPGAFHSNLHCFL